MEFNLALESEEIIVRRLLRASLVKCPNEPNFKNRQICHLLASLKALIFQLGNCDRWLIPG